MATERVGVMTGNLIEVLVNDQIIGVIQNINANEDLGLQAATGIGRPTPYEHVVGQVRYSLSVDVLQVLPEGLWKGKNPELEALGIKNFEDAGISPKGYTDLLKGTVFDIVVRTLADGVQLYKWTACSYGSGSIQIGKHTITSRNASFLAINKIYGTGAPA